MQWIVKTAMLSVVNRTRAGTLVALVFLAAARLIGGEGPVPGEGAAETPGSEAKSAVEYVPGRGVLFRTADRLLEASLGFNLQVRFTHFDLGAAAAGAETNEFRVRRLKLYLAGFFGSPRLTWRFQAAFENAGNPRLLDDAWMSYRFHDTLRIQGGQYKTPFTREELMNDGVLQFTERAIAVDSFKAGRDIGAMAQGSFRKGLFTYQAGVFGGAGQSTPRTKAHVMPMLRIVANPWGNIGEGEPDLENRPRPALSIGANGFLNTLVKTSDTAFESSVPPYASRAGWLGRNVPLFQTGEVVRIQSWGFDAQWKWRGAFVQGEYLRGRAEGRMSGARLYAYGWYAQAGYVFLPGRMDGAARYAYVDTDQNARGDGLATVTGAVNYYVRKHNLKLALDYTRTHRQRAGGSPANDQAVLVQAQLMP